MSKNVKAALFIVIAMIMISSNDVILKLSSENLGVGQLLFIRGMLATTVFMIILKLTGNPLFSRQTVDNLNVARACCECLATFCFVSSLGFLSIATASTLVWTSPILLTICSALYLKESVSPARWGAVVLGFIGVVCVTNPFGGNFKLAMLLPLATACFLVARNIITQKLESGIQSIYVVFASLVLVTITGGVISMFDWQPVQQTHVIWLLVSAVLLSVGFYLEITAMRIGELSFLAPFLFTSILVAVIWGYIVWNDIPSVMMLIGITLVVVSGLIILINKPKSHRSITVLKTH